MNGIWKFFDFLKKLVTGDWKATIATIFGVIVGICLIIIGACGDVLREIIIGKLTLSDQVAQMAGIVTRDGGVIGLGALALTLLIGAIALAIAKFRTAIARLNAQKRKYDKDSMSKVLQFGEKEQIRHEA